MSIVRDLADSAGNIVAGTGIEHWAFEASLSVSAEDTVPTDIFFSSDGTKMYVLGDLGNDVNQYALSTPWNISTATFEKNTLLNLTVTLTVPTGLYFSSDGTRMFVCDSTADIIVRYSLSTPWDIATLAYVSQFSTVTEETIPEALFFSSDGTKMYLMGTFGDDINQYNLPTPWDITTATFEKLFSVSFESTPTALDFDDNGSTMYIAGQLLDTIYRYTLSTPWDIGTAVRSGAFSIDYVETFNENQITGVYVNGSIGKMYFVGSGADRVFQFNSNGMRLLADSWSVSGDLHAKKQLFVYDDTNILGALDLAGSATIGSTVSVSGAVTLSSTITLNGTSLSLGSSGTHTINSSSTSSRALQIFSQATTSGNTKTLDLATAGASGSITRVEIGSAVSGSLGKLDFNLLLAEQATVSATAATGTVNLDIYPNANVTYYTTNASGNWTLNIRGNSTTTYDSITDTGQSVTIVFAVTNGATPYYQTGFQIDGSAQTIRWQGGTAPTSGNANSIDVYTFTIIKTAATPTYVVLGSVTRFA